MIDSDAAVEAAAQASSQVTSPVGLVLGGVLVLAFGLVMLFKPRQVSRPARWEYKGPERPEPSDFVVDVIRIFGFLWAAAGVAIIVAAFVA